MTLLSRRHLLNEFERLLQDAERIDMAVAWICFSQAFTMLTREVRRRKLALRIVVGLSGNITDPEALRALLEFPDLTGLRAGPQPPGGIFHPKFYLFHLPQRKICWVGSANFTGQGFGVN